MVVASNPDPRLLPAISPGRDPGAWAELAVASRGDDQDDEELQPIARSTKRCDKRDAKHASVPLRRVGAGEVRGEKFLYELKAGPAAAACGAPAAMSR